MINILNGILTKDQEIVYELNKESAIQILSLHKFSIGEIFVSGYYTSPEKTDKELIIAVGVEEGIGPNVYRIISDQRIIVVTAVLNEMPDVSTIALNQRYLVKTDKIYYLSRVRDQDSGTVVFRKTELTEKCVIHDASTGDIYICNPPELASLFDSLAKPGLSDVKVENGEVSVDVEVGEDKFDGLHFVTKEEKSYLTTKIFDEDFTTEVTYQTFNKNGEPVDSVDPCVVEKTVYYLSVKMSGKNVKLDKDPEGWTYDEKLGVYTKTILGNKTSDSGEVECVYTNKNYTGQKITTPVVANINKYMFFLYSPEEPTVSEIIRIGKAHLVSSIAGEYTIKPREGDYTWFLFPEGMEPESITQLGLNYVSPETTNLEGVTWKLVNLGTYKVYRSLNTGNGLNQNITIK